MSKIKKILFTGVDNIKEAEKEKNTENKRNFRLFHKIQRNPARCGSADYLSESI